MERASSGSNSKRSNRKTRRLRAAFVAAAVPLLSGCAYSRIAVDGGVRPPPPPRNGERLEVVSCSVVTAKAGTDAWRTAAARKTREREVPGIGPALRRTDPDWFSTGAGTIPVVVRLRADVDDTERSTPFLLLSAASLGTIPGRAPIRFRLGASIQLGPGEWSDADPVPAQEDFLAFNPVSSLAFSWFLSEEDGWRRSGRFYRTAQDGDRLSLSSYLQDGEERNEAFLRIVSSLVAGAWTDLSPAQRRKAARNPVAVRLWRERHLLDGGDGGGDISVAVVGPPADANAKIGDPIVLVRTFDPESRRGAVVFDPNGTERIRALKWIRENVLPELAGSGVPVRILGEDSSGADRVEIKFGALE